MSGRLVPVVIGVAMAAAGLLLLLRNLEVIPEAVTVWPVIIIAVGVVILTAGLRQQEQGAGPEKAATRLEGATQARLSLKHGAGMLTVSGAAQADHLFDGTFAGGVREERQRVGDRLDVTLRHPTDPDRLFRQSRGLRWQVALTESVPLDLGVQTGASKVSLDLEEVAVRDLHVQTGASEVDIRLPARGHCRVRVTAGAAEVRVHVPADVAAQIVSRGALASLTVDQVRFPAGEGGYRSSGYDEAEHRAVIEFDGGVASFTVD